MSLACSYQNALVEERDEAEIDNTVVLYQIHEVSLLAHSVFYCTDCNFARFQ
jgi:hypothetical protein